MTIDKKTYKTISDIVLWFKVQNGDTLYLIDIPQIISLRWTFIRDNWDFLLSDMEHRLTIYSEPDYLKTQIDEMTSFILTQRSTKINSNPFENEEYIYRFHAIFENIAINSIPLTKIEQDIIDSEINRINKFNKIDFISMKTLLRDAIDAYADEVGLSDTTYNGTYSRSSSLPMFSPTIPATVRLNMLLDNVKALDYIIANSKYLDNTFIDPFALARANANNNIDIRSNKSCYIGRIYHGETLDQVAKRYLNDPKRWIDIAIANGLKTPYIDEIGEKIPLISNGDENKINIGSIDVDGNLNSDKLYVNQVLFIQSSVKTIADQRTITDISIVPVSGDIVITVDGDSNMDDYKISESATIRIFKPNTINSNFFILIPSEEPLTNSREESVPFFLQSKKEDEKQTKVDIALDSDGDIMFGSANDVMLSYGLANAIQAINLKFNIKLGTINQHPDFGFIDVIGNKSSTETRDSIIKNIENMIQNDSRFDRIESLNVIKTEPNVVQVRLVVRLAGSSLLIPISFKVPI